MARARVYEQGVLWFSRAATYEIDFVVWLDEMDVYVREERRVLKRVRGGLFLDVARDQWFWVL